MNVEKIWIEFEDKETLAEKCALEIIKLSKESISRNNIFKIVLAGGSTPVMTYKILSRIHNDFSKWSIFFGDERFLPENDPDLNYNIAWEAWLKNHQFHSINSLPFKSSQKESVNLETLLKENTPFDLVLLGMGEDGHTASLFPGHVHGENELFHYIDNSPKPPAERISLSARTLSNTENLYFLISGSGKKDAVKKWKSGIQLPVSSVSSSSPVQIFIDKDANCEKSEN